MTPIRRLLHEPALHFVLVGALLFVVHAIVAPPEAAPPAPPGVIEVDERQVADLLDDWRQRHGRAPTAAEREAVIEDWIRDEALVREALRLGIERTDPRVRQRLVQVMELVIDDAADLGAPDDETLARWTRDNEALYREPARVTLEHVAAELVTLDRLRAGAAPEGLDVERVDDVSRTRLSSQLGQAVAEAAFEVAPQTWIGPIDAAGGPRFLRVLERSPGGLPPLDAIRERALADWLDEVRRQRRDAAIDDLLERRYEVRRLDAPEPPR